MGILCNIFLVGCTLGDSMIRKVCVSISLLFGLLGCNISAPLNNEKPIERTNEVQINLPTTEVIFTASLTPFDSSSILTSLIQIESIPYTAYQIPGDPFRFVCQEPCQLDLQYIYAEYAGFRLGHAMLIELTGIDTLTELQPVDMHLELSDSICSESPAAHAYVYTDMHQAYTCIDGPGYYPTIEEKIQRAARFDEQYFPLHEYMHTIFFGRISGKAGDFEDGKAYFFHDYVVPVPAYAIGVRDPAGFCTSDTRELPPGDFGGLLISELCRQYGFELADLALSLIELDRLYQSGAGLDYQEGYEHPVPTVAQYRDILNTLLGNDTTGAFAAACWPPELFDNSYSPLPACVIPVESGTPTPLK
jgi:hypothetical protein